MQNDNIPDFEVETRPVPTAEQREPWLYVTPKVVLRTIMDDYDRTIKLYASLYQDPMLDGLYQLYIQDLKAIAELEDPSIEERKRAFELGGILNLATLTIKQRHKK